MQRAFVLLSLLCSTVAFADEPRELTEVERSTAVEFSLDADKLTTGQRVWLTVYTKHRQACPLNDRSRLGHLSGAAITTCYQREHELQLQLVEISAHVCP